MALPLQTKRRIFAGIVTALILTLALLLVVVLRAPRPLRFAALDIGQGDALFVEAPSGTQMLIDGGPSNTLLDRLGRAMPLFDRSIDVVLMTHPDADHITGLVEVVRRYHIGTLITTGVKGDSAVYETLLDEVRRQKIPVHYALAGQTIPLDTDVSYTMLWPEQSWQGKSAKDTNDTSIVGRLSYKEFSVMLMGDASTDVERALVQSATVLQSTVLKAGHHGSRTSTSAEFLDAVRPTSVILSVGAKNRYGHPHKEVLGILASRPLVVYRTDERGDIMYTSDGHQYDIHFGLGFRLW